MFSHRYVRQRLVVDRALDLHEVPDAVAADERRGVPTDQRRRHCLGPGDALLQYRPEQRGRAEHPARGVEQVARGEPLEFSKIRPPERNRVATD